MAQSDFVVDRLEHDDAVLAVLRETLAMLRAALDAVLDGDDAGDYGLTGC